MVRLIFLALLLASGLGAEDRTSPWRALSGLCGSISHLPYYDALSHRLTLVQKNWLGDMEICTWDGHDWSRWNVQTNVWGALVSVFPNPDTRRVVFIVSRLADGTTPTGPLRWLEWDGETFTELGDIPGTSSWPQIGSYFLATYNDSLAAFYVANLEGALYIFDGYRWDLVGTLPDAPLGESALLSMRGVLWFLGLRGIWSWQEGQWVRAGASVFSCHDFGASDRLGWIVGVGPSNYHDNPGTPSYVCLWDGNRWSVSLTGVPLLVGGRFVYDPVLRRLLLLAHLQAPTGDFMHLYEYSPVSQYLPLLLRP